MLKEVMKLKREKNPKYLPKLQSNKAFTKQKNFLAFFFCLILIMPLIFFMVQIKPVVSRNTIYVPDDYPTIQEAVNNAIAGETIYVADTKIYYEHVVVNKSLAIIGENPATTIVDGTENGTVFRLEASRITITGFTIRNAGDDRGAITAFNEIATNDYHNISNNIITTSAYGVYLWDSNRNIIFNNTFYDNYFDGISLSSADENTVARNIISESANGIKLTSSLNNIIENNIISETSYAIYISSVSTGNTVRYNTVKGKTIGIFVSSDNNTVHHNSVIDGAHGIYFYNTKKGNIYYNVIANTSYGIRLYETSVTTTEHQVSNNKITNTDWAIELVKSDGNTFMGNWIQQNTYGANIDESSFNVFHRNNFIENNEQVHSPNPWDSLNSWNMSKEGNYWSDYTGEDEDGDGIGDTKYTVYPYNYDYCPLMDTWSQHDIHIVNVTASTNRTYTGSIVNITVTVENKGKAGTSETFNVTLKLNELPIETKTVTNLAPEENQTLTFRWNTTEVTPRTNYTISVEVIPVPDELNTDNNRFIDGTVYVKLIGDVNDDGIVDIFDIGFISAHWNPDYHPDADLNYDGIVDIFDVGIVSAHWGETA